MSQLSSLEARLVETAQHYDQLEIIISSIDDLKKQFDEYKATVQSLQEDTPHWKGEQKQGYVEKVKIVEEEYKHMSGVQLESILTKLNEKKQSLYLLSEELRLSLLDEIEKERT